MPTEFFRLIQTSLGDDSPTWLVLLLCFLFWILGLLVNQWFLVRRESATLDLKQRHGEKSIRFAQKQKELVEHLPIIISELSQAKSQYVTAAYLLAQMQDLVTSGGLTTNVFQSSCDRILSNCKVARERFENVRLLLDDEAKESVRTAISTLEGGSFLLRQYMEFYIGWASAPEETKKQILRSFYNGAGKSMREVDALEAKLRKVLYPPE